MRDKLAPFTNFTAPGQFHLPGQSLHWAAGHRSGATFFALTETISSWHVTSPPSIRTWNRLAASPWPEAHRRLSGLAKNVSPRRGHQLI